MSEVENIDDELLCAYLDDELSSEERARVDARLASDPAARQMLDQLRSASQAMKSLPQETVGEDLRESVLRRAEAAMLTGRGGPRRADAAKSAEADHTSSSRNSLPRLTIGQTRRGWIWASLALAAGLLIMILQPANRERNSQLGDVAASKNGEALDKLGISDRAEVPELHNLSVGEPTAEPATAAPAAPADSVALQSGVTNSASPAAAAAPAAVRDETRELAAAKSRGSARNPATSGGVPAAAGPASGARNTLAEGYAFGQFGEQATEGSELSDGVLAGAASASAPRSSAESTRRYLETPPRSAIGGELQLGAGRVATNQPSRTNALAKTLATTRPDDFLVVRVVVAPEAAQNNAFGKLLAKHGIEFESLPEAESASASSETKSLEEGISNRKYESSLDAKGQQNGSQNSQDAVLVEAPRKTIELCLADLKLDQANYLGIAVDGLAAPATADGVDKTADKAKVDSEIPSKDLTTSWGTNYNRGEVLPKESEDYYAKYFYDYDAGGGRDLFSGRGLARSGGGFGGGTPERQQQLRARFDSSRPEGGQELAEGRARRLRLPRFDDSRDSESQVQRGTVADVESSGTALQYGAEPNQSGLRNKSQSEILKVLFVLTSGASRSAPATPPSPPAENPPE